MDGINVLAESLFKAEEFKQELEEFMDASATSVVQELRILEGVVKKEDEEEELESPVYVLVEDLKEEVKEQEHKDPLGTIGEDTSVANEEDTEYKLFQGAAVSGDGEVAADFGCSIFGVIPDQGPPVQLLITTASHAVTSSGGSGRTLALPRQRLFSDALRLILRVSIFLWAQTACLGPVWRGAADEVSTQPKGPSPPPARLPRLLTSPLASALTAAASAERHLAKKETLLSTNARIRESDLIVAATAERHLAEEEILLSTKARIRKSDLIVAKCAIRHLGTEGHLLFTGAFTLGSYLLVATNAARHLTVSKSLSDTCDRIRESVLLVAPCAVKHLAKNNTLFFTIAHTLASDLIYVPCAEKHSVVKESLTSTCERTRKSALIVAPCAVTHIAENKGFLSTNARTRVSDLIVAHCVVKCTDKNKSLFIMNARIRGSVLTVAPCVVRHLTGKINLLITCAGIRESALSCAFSSRGQLAKHENAHGRVTLKVQSFRQDIYPGTKALLACAVIRCSHTSAILSL